MLHGRWEVIACLTQFVAKCREDQRLGRANWESLANSGFKSALARKLKRFHDCCDALDAREPGAGSQARQCLYDLFAHRYRIENPNSRTWIAGTLPFGVRVAAGKAILLPEYKNLIDVLVRGLTLEQRALLLTVVETRRGMESVAGTTQRSSQIRNVLRSACRHFGALPEPAGAAKPGAGKAQSKTKR